jgi:hypothetical protein
MTGFRINSFVAPTGFVELEAIADLFNSEVEASLVRAFQHFPC